MIMVGDNDNYNDDGNDSKYHAKKIFKLLNF